MTKFQELTCPSCMHHLQCTHQETIRYTLNIDQIIFSRKHFVHTLTTYREYLGDMEILLLLFTLLLCPMYMKCQVCCKS